MPHRSNMMTQTKKDTLVLQVGGVWVWDLQPHPIKIYSVEELLKLKMRSTKDGNDRRSKRRGKALCIINLYNE